MYEVVVKVMGKEKDVKVRAFVEPTRERSIAPSVFNDGQEEA